METKTAAERLLEGWREVESPKTASQMIGATCEKVNRINQEAARVLPTRSIYDRMVMGPQLTQEQAFEYRMLKAGAKGYFPLELGVISAKIWGGPYRSKPADVLGIKMAEEIIGDAFIGIPTRDFDVPAVGRFIAGLYAGIALAQQGYPLWVGCMGGIGRTGLYFGGLAKVMWLYQKVAENPQPGDPPPIQDYIKFVRSTYYSHAIETHGQIQFLANLDVDDIVRWVVALQPKKKPWYRKALGI